MTILSAQSIRKQCDVFLYQMVPLHTEIKFPWEPSPTPPPSSNWPDWKQTTGFILTRALKSDIEKPLIDPFVERGIIRGRSYGLSACTYDCRIAHPLIIPVSQARLAVTIERFNFPHNICGSVLDKSSWARVFISAFNTHLDPGWCGYLTLELVNLGSDFVEFQENDPICQVKFEWLDEATELPYKGKYQNQENKPTPAIEEKI
jgi:dCTP deaminase